MNPKPSSVEEYLSWFSPEIREKLEQIRATILKALPNAKEVISYHMPSYKTTEDLVYFAAAKKHIGFYPTNSGVSEFKKELEGFVTSKGAIQIPYDKPLPLKLIADIAKFRAEEAEQRAKAKKKK
ncbi:iron chaperone [Algoriphagus yeomjeoni]|uniref:iron chaperone n=1 Tax=Algoriphagus yeomjeoni TaxID=291403 RepID=UPI003CE58F5B